MTTSNQPAPDAPSVPKLDTPYIQKAYTILIPLIAQSTISKQNTYKINGIPVDDKLIVAVNILSSIIKKKWPSFSMAVNHDKNTITIPRVDGMNVVALRDFLSKDLGKQTQEQQGRKPDHASLSRYTVVHVPRSKTHPAYRWQIDDTKTGRYVKVKDSEYTVTLPNGGSAWNMQKIAILHCEALNKGYTKDGKQMQKDKASFLQLVNVNGLDTAAAANADRDFEHIERMINCALGGGAKTFRVAKVDASMIRAAKQVVSVIGAKFKGFDIAINKQANTLTLTLGKMTPSTYKKWMGDEGEAEVEAVAPKAVKPKATTVKPSSVITPKVEGRNSTDGIAVYHKSKIESHLVYEMAFNDSAKKHAEAAKKNKHDSELAALHENASSSTLNASKEHGKAAKLHAEALAKYVPNTAESENLTNKAKEASRTAGEVTSKANEVSQAAYKAAANRTASKDTVKPTSKNVKKEIPVETLDQFSYRTGGTITADVDGHIHAGIANAPKTKTYAKFYATKLKDLQDKRDATTEAYHEAIRKGEIRAPSKNEELYRKANGHPDNPAIQAAQRVLAKRAVRAAQNSDKSSLLELGHVSINGLDTAAAADLEREFKRIEKMIDRTLNGGAKTFRVTSIDAAFVKAAKQVVSVIGDRFKGFDLTIDKKAGTLALTLGKGMTLSAYKKWMGDEGEAEVEASKPIPKTVKPKVVTTKPKVMVPVVKPATSKPKAVTSIKEPDEHSALLSIGFKAKSSNPNSYTHPNSLAYSKKAIDAFMTNHSYTSIPCKITAKSDILSAWSKGGFTYVLYTKPKNLQLDKIPSSEYEQAEPAIKIPEKETSKHPLTAGFAIRAIKDGINLQVKKASTGYHIIFARAKDNLVIYKTLGLPYNGKLSDLYGAFEKCVTAKIGKSIDAYNHKTATPEETKECLLTRDKFRALVEPNFAGFQANHPKYASPDNPVLAPVDRVTVNPQ